MCIKMSFLYIVYFASCIQKDNRVDCGEGRYSKPGDIDCKQCPVGTYCPFLRTESPLPCPKGFYSIKNGSSKCIECERGAINMQFWGCSHEFKVYFSND